MAPATSISALEWAAFATLALGIALSGAILYVHEQLAASGGAYTSFCNVNARVNCDVVLTSPFGALFGVPVALWALLTYGAIAVLLAVRRRARGETRARATVAMLGLALWSFVFSLYMAAVAAFAVGALCLLCSGLYVVNGAIAVLAWRLARGERWRAAPLVTTRRVTVGVGVLAAALAVVGAAQLAGGSGVLSNLTPADVQARNPEFYDWYTTRPLAEGLPQPAHVRGPADAPITIVEFSDFECAYCAKAYRDIRDLERRHPGSVRVAFHHFPLDPGCNAHVSARVHRFACQAAVAAECAARFDRFWDYHDRLFGNQDRLGREDLIATAGDLGIDHAAFSACLDDTAPHERVAADTAAGARVGVTSTPTLFINGRTVEGALDHDFYEYVLALERHG